MAKNNFLLLSLEDDQARKVATVISNESCRKILDYLSENKDATESDLARTLNLPISTVHYNFQQLVHAGLVAVDEFHYSEKGREVNHYRLANKYIIITPKKTISLRDKLMRLLPVAFVAAAAALVLQLLQNVTTSQFFTAKEMAAVPAPLNDMIAAAPAEAAPRAASVVTGSAIMQSWAFWFLVGALFALLVYFAWGLVKKE